MSLRLKKLVAHIRVAFPDAMAETERQGADGNFYSVHAIRPEFLRELQGEELDLAADRDRYELQFPGKRLARAQAGAPPQKTLAPDKAQSLHCDSTGNLFIEGDNLDALRALQNSYHGKIKVIYIDPPYNTGNDGFVYNDDFGVRQKRYLRDIGALSEDGARQVDEVRNGLRGRFHAGWLAMMYPRLKLARELLTEDGVIFISIDDNEQANLKLLCDEIFGEENLVGQFIWQTKQQARGVPPNTMLMSNHEYVACYSRNFEKVKFFGEERDEGNFNNPDNDPRGLWRSESMRATGGGGNAFSIVSPDTGLSFFGKWAFSERRIKQMVEENLVLFPRDGKGTPRQKKFMDSYRNERKAIVTTCGWFSTEKATTRFNEMFDGHRVFPSPKPVELIRFFAKQMLGDSDTILDFFAGSGTTAHAVMQLNAEDGGKRKFILVQWAEEISPKKSPEAHRFCVETLKRPANIAEIAKERIRRAGAKIRAEHPESDIDAGFLVYVAQDSLLNNGNNKPLAETAQEELSAFITELKRENFAPLLCEALLETGAPLNGPIAEHEAMGYPFAVCDRRCYCVTENLTQAIVREIVEEHGEEFDIFHYLGDCLGEQTSHTELESAIFLAKGEKQIQALNFY